MLAEERRKASVPERVVTFKDVALDYTASHKAGWRNAKHGQQWVNTLTTYAFPTIGEMPVAEVDEESMLDILKPMWLSRTGDGHAGALAHGRPTQRSRTRRLPTHPETQTSIDFPEARSESERIESR